MKTFLALCLCLFSFCASIARAQEKTGDLDIDLVVPAVVVAGEKFSVIYRTTPKTLLSLEPEFATRSKLGKIGKGKIVSDIASFPARHHQAILTETGYFLLVFALRDQAGQLHSATARTTVLLPNQKPLFEGSPWELPRKNLYLSPEPAVSWNQAPPEKREILGLERVFFSPLLEIPDYNRDYYPIRAWNAMHEIFQPAFLPPPAFVKAFENPSLYPPKFVAYATWSQAGANFIFQTEIGQTAWVVIESPSRSAPFNLKKVFRPALLAAPSLTGEKSGRAFLARWLKTYRALAPDAPFEMKNVWLVQIGQSDEPNLHLPGPRAPEFPRLPAPKR